MKSPLSTQSLSQLRELALQCGINRSGTKTTLVSLIGETLSQHQPLRPDARVLSIDLGIRNLAFSLLSPPAAGSVKPRSAPPKFPVVHAWRPLALVPGAKEVDVVSPDFSPASLAGITLSLVQNHLLPLKPTHVLIERQRFRSGGGSGVYEWTVRVNSLEAMLYATFSTLKGLGHWDGVVVPVDPKRVGPFLLEDRNPDDGDKSKVAEEEVDTTVAKAKKSGLRSARENKKRKIDLLGSWLARDEIPLVGVEAEAMRRTFLEKWSPKEYRGKLNTKGSKSKAKSKGPAVSIKKLDDVTDSLLQGIAWIRWEERKDELKEAMAK